MVRESREEARMVKVYRHRVGPDDYVGRVEDDGRVYAQRIGPDTYEGRVERDGKVYQHVSGPDRYLGRVEDDGKIYLHVPGGPDLNVGRVEENGKVYLRREGITPDQLLGRIEGDVDYLAGGAAFFLLLQTPE